MLIDDDGSGAPVWQWSGGSGALTGTGGDDGELNRRLLADEVREAAVEGKLSPVFLETTLIGDHGELALLTDVSAAFMTGMFAPWSTEALAVETALNERAALRERGKRGMRTLTLHRFDEEWSTFLGGSLAFLTGARCPGLAGFGMKFSSAWRNGELKGWLEVNRQDFPAFELKIRAPKGKSAKKMGEAAEQLCAMLAEAGPTAATARRGDEKDWLEIQTSLYAELAARREAAELGRTTAGGKPVPAGKRGP